MCFSLYLQLYELDNDRSKNKALMAVNRDSQKKLFYVNEQGFWNYGRNIHIKYPCKIHIFIHQKQSGENATFLWMNGEIGSFNTISYSSNIADLDCIYL